jgi:hypothetical protein
LGNTASAKRTLMALSVGSSDKVPTAPAAFPLRAFKLRRRRNFEEEGGERTEEEELEEPSNKLFRFSQNGFSSPAICVIPTIKGIESTRGKVLILMFLI